MRSKGQLLNLGCPFFCLVTAGCLVDIKLIFDVSAATPIVKMQNMHFGYFFISNIVCIKVLLKSHTYAIVNHGTKE